MRYFLLVLLMVMTAQANATTITSPSDAVPLTSSSATFQLAPVANATEYSLWLGTRYGGYQLASLNQTSNVFTVTGLPTDGSLIYARIYNRVNGTWAHTNSVFTAWDGVTIPPTDPEEPTTDNGDPLTVSGEVILTTGMTNAEMGPIIQSIMLIFVVAFGFRMILRQLR